MFELLELTAGLGLFDVTPALDLLAQAGGGGGYGGGAVAAAEVSAGAMAARWSIC